MQFHIYRNFVKFVWKNKNSHGHVSFQRLYCGWTSSHLSAFPDLSTCVRFFWMGFICCFYLFWIHNWTCVLFFVLLSGATLRMFIPKNGRLKKEEKEKKKLFALLLLFCFKDVKHPKHRDRTTAQDKIFMEMCSCLSAGLSAREWTSLCVGLLTFNCRETCQRVCV